MRGVTAIRSSAVSREQLSQILGDYLALDRARRFRRLLLKRFGLLTLGAIAIAIGITGESASVRWALVALFAAPPVLASIAELRLERRLSRRCDGIDVAARHNT
ncbi:MAG TPA: hypothetical protein VKB50_14670 [Vicinamibacterales bacterium]|nr:hypothetical protein [Vicinamibacterales bacterium]